MEKAASDRVKVIKELNQLRMEALTVGMSCQNHEALTDIHNGELKRMTHAVAAAEKAFDDLFDLYKNQFDELVNTIDANTSKMNDLRAKQDEAKTSMYELKCRVHDGQMDIDSMKIERDMRVNLDDQYETSRLMIMIEDTERRARGSQELADRAVADWSARINDVQRNIDLMHT